MTKTPPIAIIPTREAVALIQRKLPPGTVVRDKVKGREYVMGVKSGLSSFHMMSVDGQIKTTQHSNRILLAFEKVNR